MRQRQCKPLLYAVGSGFKFECNRDAAHKPLWVYLPIRYQTEMLNVGVEKLHAIFVPYRDKHFPTRQRIGKAQAASIWLEHMRFERWGASIDRLHEFERKLRAKRIA
jgi:hypothetical protein